MEASLTEILDAREKRVQTQRELLEQYQKPLLSFTMNIPGPVKLDRDVSIGFYVGCRLLSDALRGCKVLYRREERHITGCEGYYVVDMPAKELKQLAIDLEDSDIIGRLFDMDVLDTDGRKLTREELGYGRRKCLLCEKDAVVCARSRAHGLEQLQDRTGFLLYIAARQHLCELIASRAYLALQQEVSTTPKPGLVDRSNSGSHKDMDTRHFFASATALRPFFCRFAQQGFLTRDQAPEEAFCQLRTIGLEAEEAMLRATGGANTHKGAIFSLGILCAAAGRLPPERWQAETLLNECAAMTAGLTEKDFAGVTVENAKTFGQLLYVQTGIAGVRGQAEAGFPAVLQVGLPILKQGLARGMNLNDAGCSALLHLLCATDDTNMVRRSSLERLRQLQQQIGQELQKDPFPSAEYIRQLDEAFIRENLSPGGSADLLAITYFLLLLCK